ncbi:hypothetical protein M3Y99_00441500 [Aphelenchoides fujianensis]|nr:hypothetical protein M3Y99_00441500 [Aphelenchoides fujianensis]
MRSFFNCKKMGKHFESKAVIVTGSSSGIGQTTAVTFAKAGASVVVHGRNEKGIQETIQLIEKAGVSKDRVAAVLGSLEEEKTLKQLVDTAIQKFGRIDVLVNAAGIGTKPNTPPESVENYDFVMNVNLKAPTFLTLLCVPHLEKTKGNIVNVSSIAGQIATQMGFYGLAKAALDHSTRQFAITLAPKGIRVNTLSPGLVRTAFQERMMPGEGGKAFIDEFEKTIPVGRSGTPQEMADAIKYLAGPKAAYMTGQMIVQDGGTSLKH